MNQDLEIAGQQVSLYWNGTSTNPLPAGKQAYVLLAALRCCSKQQREVA